MSGVLKNALDWLVGSGELYRKPVAVLSAATSGGLHARATTTRTLTWQGAHVIEELGIAGPRAKIDQGRVTGLVDFAEASAAPADVELDNILRWCATARAFPPVPGDQGLDETTLTEVPGWLHGAYPELFKREQLRERLRFYDMHTQLAQLVHHPHVDGRRAARNRISDLLSGHHDVDGLVW